MLRNPVALLARLGNEPEGLGAESRLRVVCLAIISLVGPVMLLGFSMRLLGFHLSDSDALDYAQLGRSLLAGHGFVTHILRPLALTHGHDPLTQPDVTHGPLFPFLLALSFGAFGARDTVAMGLSGLC